MPVYKPELAVRRLVHAMGYRVRLHKTGLPNKPDMAFAGRRKVIFVHGCFWLGHEDPECIDGRMPKSNLDYRRPKLDRSKHRDAASCSALAQLGWEVLIVWESELKDTNEVQAKVRRLFDRHL